MRAYLPVLALLAFPAFSFSQQCAVIGTSHFGGAQNECLTAPGLMRQPDGSFRMVIAKSVPPSSGYTPPSQQYSIRDYTADFSDFQEHRLPDDFPTDASDVHAFPQSNGSQIIFWTDPQKGDIAAAKWDASGQKTWSSVYGGSKSEYLQKVRMLPDGGFIIAGASYSKDGDVGFHYGNAYSSDIWVCRLDKDGQVMWSKVLGGSDWDLAGDVQPAVDGGFMVFGVSASNDGEGTGNKGGDDLLVVKLNGKGEKEWSHCYGDTGNDGYASGLKTVADDTDGFFVLTRSIANNAANETSADVNGKAWLLHLDAKGDVLQKNTYGGSLNLFPAALCRTENGTLWIGATFSRDIQHGDPVNSSYGKNDAWVGQIDGSGKLMNQRILGNDQMDDLTALAPLPDGSVMAIGSYRPTGNPHASPGFPITATGKSDIFMVRLSAESEKGTSVQPVFSGAWQWKLYPNPADDAFTLQAGQPFPEHNTLLITDAAGRKIRSLKITKMKTRIDCLSLPSGSYRVTLTDLSGRAETQPITIKH